MPWKNVPCCEACWIQREGEWVPYGRTDDGAPLEQLTSLRKPVRMVDPPLEQCGFCGKPTFIGIYVRAQVA